MKVIIFTLILIFLPMYVIGATIYYCSKCGSTNIEIVSTDPPPTDKKVSIDDLPASLVTYDLRLRYFAYKATCKQCRYFKEYSTPY